MRKILESKAAEVVEDPEQEPEVDDEPEPRLEIIAELVSPQEKNSSQPTEVVKMAIEILINLPPESTVELVSSLTAMRGSLSLRSPDKYDHLQICL